MRRDLSLEKKYDNGVQEARLESTCGGRCQLQVSRWLKTKEGSNQVAQEVTANGGEDEDDKGTGAWQARRTDSRTVAQHGPAPLQCFQYHCDGKENSC